MKEKKKPLSPEYVRHERRGLKIGEFVFYFSGVAILGVAVFCETMMPWTGFLWLLVLSPMFPCLACGLVCTSRLQTLSMIIVNMSNPWVVGSSILAGIGVGLLLVWCLISKHNTKEGKIALLLILLSLGCHTIYTSKNWQYVQTTRGRVLVDLPAHGMFVTTGAYVVSGLTLTA